MARSELLLVAMLATGCDAVFGVTGDIEPCELGTFEDASGVDIVEANDFSFDSEASIGVIVHEGLTYELDVANATRQPIDLGLYPSTSYAMTPEGNALFYTAMIEPPTLRGALRGGAAEWTVVAGVPRGTFAGTPSANLFGPRRVLVKLRNTLDEVQEYEDVGGVWTAVGEPHAIATDRPPNLVPNALTMVYVGVHDNVPAVFAAQRASVDEWFGEPTLLRTGDVKTAQLLGQCKQLYALDGTMVRRFSR